MVLCPSQDRLKKQRPKRNDNNNQQKKNKKTKTTDIRVEQKPKAKSKEQRGSGSARPGAEMIVVEPPVDSYLALFFVALITQTVLSDSGRVPRNDDRLRPLCGRGLSTFTSPMSSAKSGSYLSQSG